MFGGIIDGSALSREKDVKESVNVLEEYYAKHGVAKTDNQLRFIATFFPPATRQRRCGVDSGVSALSAQIADGQRCKAQLLVVVMGDDIFLISDVRT